MKAKWPCPIPQDGSPADKGLAIYSHHIKLMHGSKLGRCLWLCFSNAFFILFSSPDAALFYLALLFAFRSAGSGYCLSAFYQPLWWQQDHKRGLVGNLSRQQPQVRYPAATSGPPGTYAPWPSRMADKRLISSPALPCLQVQDLMLAAGCITWHINGRHPSHITLRWNILHVSD